MAVDEKQLDATIKQAFGSATNTEAYLCKFIDFKMDLDVGTINSSFEEKYPDYIAMFDKNIFKTDFDYNEFFAALFSDIKVRDQEHIMQKITTAHRILFDNTKKDISFMCFEMMWMVLAYHYKKRSADLIIADSNNGRLIFDMPDKVMKYFRSICNNIRVIGDSYLYQENTRDLTIPYLLIWYWESIFPDVERSFRFRSAVMPAPEFQSYFDDFKKLDQLYSILK